MFFDFYVAGRTAILPAGRQVSAFVVTHFRVLYAIRQGRSVI